MTSVVPSGSNRPTSFYSRTLRLSATTFLLKSGMSTAELQTWGMSELTFPERVPLGSPRVGTSCMCCQCGGRAPGPRLRLSAFPATRCILALQHELLAWPQSLTLAVELTACPISGPGCLCEQAGGSWHGAQSQVQRLGSGTVEPPAQNPVTAISPPPGGTQIKLSAGGGAGSTQVGVTVPAGQTQGTKEGPLGS